MALSGEDKKDVQGAMGKALANKVAKVTKDGFDGKKRWGNSAIKGVGVNSPAMMEARKKHYSNENQQKMHHDSIKHVVKKEFRGPYYEKANRAFPLKKKMGTLERGATGTLDTKAADRRIKKTGSVL